MNPTANAPNRRLYEGALAVLLVTVVALIVLPVPLVLLDTLIALNISLSLVLLMIPLYTQSQSALSTFPALLLFSTLFRLSLSIASTKQIMLHANGGHVIETFGKLVVGGNVVVGLIVFTIIAVVQFIVISKGGERVAEVGARFALDAMPGKQMSIDADVRAGNITNEEAQARREELDRESKLHGAMDGAMKFVKGDAIATVIIALVNIVGGICVGTFIKGMTLADSLARYTVLTVGDGMVSQIPSLLVSVAAGVVITRVSTKANRGLSLGTEIGRQLGGSSQALGISAAVVALFALIPGFPKIPFLVIAALLGFASFALARRNTPVEEAVFDPGQMNALQADTLRPAPDAAANDAPSRSAVALRLRHSPDLLEHLDPVAFEAAVGTERRALVQSMGLPFPGLRLVQDDTLAAGTFAIDVQELPVMTAEWRDAPNTPDHDALPGWLAGRVGEAIRGHASDFIGLQEVQALLNSLERAMPDLVAEVIRTVPLIRVAEVLRHLAQEGVSLRHMRETLESLIQWGPKEREGWKATEMVRVDIGKFVVHPHLDAQGQLAVHMLSTEFESALRSGVQQGGGATLALPVDMTRQIQQSARLTTQNGTQPLRVLCAQDIRRHVVTLMQAGGIHATAIAFQEVPPTVSVKVLGQLKPPAVELRSAA